MIIYLKVFVILPKKKKKKKKKVFKSSKDIKMG